MLTLFCKARMRPKLALREMKLKTTHMENLVVQAPLLLFRKVGVIDMKSDISDGVEFEVLVYLFTNLVKQQLPLGVTQRSVT